MKSAITGTVKTPAREFLVGAWVLAVAVMTATVPDALAAEWYAEPVVRVRTEFNDNIRLTTAPHDSVWGTVADLRTTFGVRTERSGLSATPRLRFSRYRGEDNLDGDDQYLSVTSHHDTESSRFQLDAGYERDSTLARDFEDGDGDGASELLSSGIVQRRIRRQGLSLSPSWTRSLNSRTSLRLGSNYQTVSYDDTSSGLVEFDYSVVDAALTYRLNDRDQLSSTVFVNRFRAFEIGSSTDGYGILGRYDRKLTETLSAYVGLGVQRSNAEFVRRASKQEKDDTSVLANLGLSGNLERTQWELTFSRSISATGGGNVVERNEIGGSLHQRLTRRLRGVLLVTAFSDEAVGAENAFAKRDFVRFVTRLHYRITPSWTVAGAYRFTHQERETVRGVAESHAVLLTLRYAGLPWSTSW